MTDTAREQRMRKLVALVGEPVRLYLHRRTDAATADEVFGDVLLVCWRRLDDVPAEPDAAVPWAFVVARQCLQNAQRAERRRGRLVGRIIAIDPPTVAAPGTPWGVNDSDDPRAAAVTAALSRLRADDAEVLRLWAWEDLASPQIAIALGISANAAAIRLHRAKTRLKSELQKSAPPPGHVRHEEGRTTND